MTKAYKIEHFERVQHERDSYDLMLSDIINGKVVFGIWVRDPNSDNGRYRVGISDRAFPLAICQWRYQGQADVVSVYDLERWEQDMFRLRQSSSVYQPILEALLSARASLASKAA